jgi:hypothetical protein
MLPNVLPPWRQLRRPTTTPDRSRDRLVCQLLTGIRRSQEQPTATHIAPPHKRAGKEQPVPKHLKKHVNVLVARDAAEQDHLGVGKLFELGKIALKRDAVGRMVCCSTAPNARKSLTPTVASAGTSPRSVVMTCTPDRPAGGRANRPA